MSTSKRIPEQISPDSGTRGRTVPNSGIQPASAACNFENSVSRDKPIERISYKVSQAAKATGISRYVLYSAIRREHLRAFQPNEGGDLLILVEDLRAWIRGHPAGPRTKS
ncbi:MAG: helix-turn-helix domain-containing protein [Steroidobacteraceae bacterium]